MNTKAVAEITPAAAPAVSEHSVGDIMLNAPLLKQIDHMAQRMATAKATIPKHLAGSEGDCWAVIMQAIQWGMNPYVVAQKTHLVNGTLGYEAQLVNAVVQNSGMIVGPFRYEYRGEGNSLECRVGARIKGDTDNTWGEWLSIASVKVKNSPLWATNPRQQLGYLQVKNWARANCPGAILGIYTPDELREMPVEREINPAVTQPAPTTRTSSLKEKLKADEPVEDVVEEQPAVDPDDEALRELEQQEAEPLTFATVAEAINKIQAPDQAQEAIGLMAEFIGTDGNEKYKEELHGLYKSRVAELKAIADEQKQ